MTVFTLSKVPASLRGRLTRWLVEVQRGVFVGRLSARVRDGLWDVVRGSRGAGACSIAYTARGEQGFVVKTAGTSDRRPVDFDGLTLVAKITGPGLGRDAGTAGNPPEAG